MEELYELAKKREEYLKNTEDTPERAIRLHELNLTIVSIQKQMLKTLGTKKSTRTAEDLLRKLGIEKYSFRHLHTITEFIKNNDTDVKSLLDKLGEWDKQDLEITEKWMLS